MSYSQHWDFIRLFLKQSQLRSTDLLVAYALLFALHILLNLDYHSATSKVHAEFNVDELYPLYVHTYTLGGKGC